MNLEAAEKCQSRFKKVLDIPTCSICLEPMMRDLGVFSNCGHVFHFICAVNANVQSKKCPHCRKRSVEVNELHYTVEELDEVEQQMQAMLQSLSQEEQFQVADLLQKYEDTFTQLTKLKTKYTQLEEKCNNEVNKVKLLEEQKAIQIEKIQKLTERKMELKIENQALDNSNINFKKQSEQQFIEIKNLKLKIQELNYCEQIQQIIQNQSEDAHLRQIKLLPVQRQAQEFHDLYLLKVSHSKGLQNEVDQMITEMESLKKKLSKEKNQYDDLYKEYTAIRDHYRARKQERSQENSVNQISNFFDIKQKQIDSKINQITQDPYSLLKKRKPQDQSQLLNKQSQFGKSTLLNRSGIQNPLISFKND